MPLQERPASLSIRGAHFPVAFGERTHDDAGPRLDERKKYAPRRHLNWGAAPLHPVTAPFATATHCSLSIRRTVLLLLLLLRAIYN